MAVWIVLRLLLVCSWIALGLLPLDGRLDCSWIAAALFLDYSEIAAGLLLDCCWIVIGVLLGWVALHMEAPGGTEGSRPREARP